MKPYDTWPPASMLDDLMGRIMGYIKACDETTNERGHCTCYGQIRTLLHHSYVIPLRALNNSTPPPQQQQLNTSTEHD